MTRPTPEPQSHRAWAFDAKGVRIEWASELWCCETCLQDIAMGHGSDIAGCCCIHVDEHCDGRATKGAKP